VTWGVGGAGGRGENKVPKKIDIRGGKILGRGQRENKVSIKTEVRAEKGQRKKVNLGWYRDRG
jgi:hypothetical protein